MALNNNGKKDIFGLDGLVPPSNDTKTDVLKPAVAKKEKKPATKDDSAQIKSKKQKRFLMPENFFYARARFFDEDDKDFLKFYGGNLGKNQEEFMQYILDNAINDKEEITPKDEQHMQFKTQNLIYYTSIRISESYKGKIIKLAANNHLTQEQYLGYLVRKMRLKTPGW